MKWFRHDSDASQDAKLKKLVLKHGAEGYAIYFHCLELISGDVSESNITFELEHDSEIIADNLKIKSTSQKSAIEIVEEIMKTILELQLFELSEGKITCLTMAKRIDKSMIKNPLIKSIASNYESSLKIAEKSGKVLLEENRIEENRIDNIYRLYPTCDINNNDRPTHKCGKNKKQIERLILNKTYDVVYTVLSGYVKECDDKKVWLKDFTTLLNQFPDENTYKPEKSDYKPKPVEYIPMTQEQKEEARKNIEKAFGNNKAEKPDIDTNLEGIDESL